VCKRSGFFLLVFFWYLLSGFMRSAPGGTSDLRSTENDGDVSVFAHLCNLPDVRSMHIFCLFQFRVILINYFSGVLRIRSPLCTFPVLFLYILNSLILVQFRLYPVSRFQREKMHHTGFHFKF